MTLDQAEDAFTAKPTAATAASYLETLHQYRRDGMIGPLTFKYGVERVVDFLRRLPKR